MSISRKALAGLMAVDGAIALAGGRKYLKIWRGNFMPTWWNRSLGFFERRITHTRLLAGAELLLAVYLLASSGDEKTGLTPGKD